MNKYIIVYQNYTSWYNTYYGERNSEKSISNYEIEATSKEEAYNKFLEYAKEEEKEAYVKRNVNTSFTILNIIDLKG